MGAYLQQYGLMEERRNRAVRIIIMSALALVVLAVIGYFVLKDYPERQKVSRFIQDINSRQYQAAYGEWGCTAQHPCPNYDFNRFLQDWGPSSKASAAWKVTSTDSCKYFLTVNVRAPGAELQSLSVQRSDSSLGYAPSPECQEPKWRWRQFFQQYFGKPEAPPKPGHG